MIEWFSQENKSNYVSIDNKSLTFNISHLSYLSLAYSALLGVDKDKNVICVKLLDADEANRGDIDKTYQNHISVGKSYGRITNKSFVEHLQINNFIDFDGKKSIKFKSDYDSKTKTISINLKEVIS